MPKDIPVHVALREQLRVTVTTSWQLNAQLESVIAVKAQVPGGGFHGKIDFSQPPWHAPVANAIMDLHALARELEAWLRLSQGLPGRSRGGSSENTRRALENIVRLCQAAEDSTVRDHNRQLRRWETQADVALGKTERPARLPVEKGKPHPACPWCKKDTLRIMPLKGVIRCVEKTCLDENGERPRGEMTFSPIASDWIVVWQNKTVGLP